DTQKLFDTDLGDSSLGPTFLETPDAFLDFVNLPLEQSLPFIYSSPTLQETLPVIVDFYLNLEG
ncbi:MAG: hypothetical protein KDD40_06080, partial [Bdellovibrionales bacterium]|nr:hypothetical protein [Bdellovibrionales bacterium]